MLNGKQYADGVDLLLEEALVKVSRLLDIRGDSMTQEL